MQLTQEPRRLFGLRDRGRVAVGGFADLVVLDPATVGAGAAQLVHDLPGGSVRMFADPIGVHRVFVNGVEPSSTASPPARPPARCCDPVATPTP